MKCSGNNQAAIWSNTHICDEATKKCSWFPLAVKHLRELTIQKENMDTERNRVLDEKKALMRDIQ